MRLVSFLMVLLISFSVTAQTSVKKGDKVPEDGVFLTNEEAAKILAKNKASEKLCEAQIGYEKEKVTSVCALKEQHLQISLNMERQKYQAIIDLKNKELERLYKQIENTGTYDHYWFAGGLAIGGVVATVSSVAIFFAATQIDKAPSLINVE